MHFYNGDGIEKDIEKAEKYYYKAEQQGFKDFYKKTNGLD